MRDSEVADLIAIFEDVVLIDGSISGPQPQSADRRRQAQGNTQNTRHVFSVSRHARISAS